MKERVTRRAFLKLAALAGVSTLAAAACAEIPPITPVATATEPTKPPIAPATVAPVSPSPTPGATEAAPTATRKPEATASPTRKIEPTPSPTAALEIGIGLEAGAGGGALQETLGGLAMHKLTINKVGFEALNPGCKLLVPQDASGTELPEQNTFIFSDGSGKYLVSLNPTYPKPKDPKGTPVYNPNSQLVEDADPVEGWRYHVPVAQADENGIAAVYWKEGKYYQGVVDKKTGKVVSEKDYWSPWPKEASKAVLAKWGDSLYVVFTDKAGKILESERKKVLDLPKTPTPEPTATPEGYYKEVVSLNGITVELISDPALQKAPRPVEKVTLDFGDHYGRQKAEERLVLAVSLAHYFAWQQDEPATRNAVTFEQWQQMFKDGKDLSYQVGDSRQEKGVSRVDPKKPVRIIFGADPSYRFQRAFNYSDVVPEKDGLVIKVRGWAPYSPEEAKKNAPVISKSVTHTFYSPLAWLSLPEDQQQYAFPIGVFSPPLAKPWALIYKALVFSDPNGSDQASNWWPILKVIEK